MQHIPFVKIENATLTQVFQLPAEINPSTPLRVISILGKARMGKSTLMNCLVSTLYDKNAYIFPTQESTEHCTIGIDAYILADRGILLLDCQGVEYDDSSQDSKLLLLTYLLSDLIIFNERNMLSNSTLNSFQPMVAFLQYLQLEQLRKPRLFFRISDVDLELDPAQNLKNVLAEKHDQFQNIRDSVAQLFLDPVAVKTASLDRTEKNLLKRHKYTEVLAGEENGFAAAIDAIMEHVGKPERTFGQWYQGIPAIIEAINKNEKIDYKKLDIVELLAYKEIREWIEGLNLGLFTPIVTDGTHANYTAEILGREAATKKALTVYKRNFASLTDSIKQPHYDALKERFDAPVAVAIRECKEKATAVAWPLLKSAFAGYNENLSMVRTTFADYLTADGEPLETAAIWTRLKTLSDSVRARTNHLYGEVYAEVEDWLSLTKTRFLKAIAAALKEENEEYARLIDTTKQFQASIADRIVDITLRKADVGSLAKTVEQVCAGAAEQLSAAYDEVVRGLGLREVTVEKYFTTTPNPTTACSVKSHVFTSSYKLYSPRMYSYMTSIHQTFKECLADAGVRRKILAKRRQMLAALETPVTAVETVIANNPEVQFVCAQHGTHYMSMDRWRKLYYPTVYRAIKLMVDDKLLSSVVVGRERFNKECMKAVPGAKLNMFVCYTSELKLGTISTSTYPYDKYFYGLFSTIYYPKAHLQLEVEQKAAKRRAERMARRAGRKGTSGAAAAVATESASSASSASSAIPAMPTIIIYGKKYYINKRTRNLYNPDEVDIPYVGRLGTDGATIDRAASEHGLTIKTPPPTIIDGVIVKKVGRPVAAKKAAPAHP
jgi:hypothetical protein